MRSLILAVGRMKAGPEAQLLAQYAARIQPKLEVREVEEKRALPTPKLKAREAELLLAQVPQGSKVVALDERGKALTSPELAKVLGRWQDDGVRDVAYVIGGADGLDEAVRKRADLILNLGQVTWPHMLVRALIAEQVYRAQAILSGHPYHRV